jgi:hypothetical protein
MRATHSFAVAIAGWASIVLASCGEKPATETRDLFDPAAAGEHAHDAPHGGVLIELGDEAAHLEILRDEATGEVRLFVLDDSAEAAVRVAHASIEIAVSADGAEWTLALEGVASALTGETAGDTSEYRGRDDRLKGDGPVSGRIAQITVKGLTFEGVEVKIPGR